MSLTLFIKRTFYTSLFVFLTHNSLASSPQFVTQDVMKRQISSSSYQNHLNTINQLLSEKQNTALLDYIKAIQNDYDLETFSKESLLEESITALSKLPETPSGLLILKDLSKYQSETKIELTDGPHRMHVNATSVAALAKLSLENWEITALAKTFVSAINSGEFEQIRGKQVTNERVWLNAVKSAINQSDHSSLNRYLEDSILTKPSVKNLHLDFLVAKKLNINLVMQSCLISLAHSEKYRGFALQELRQLNVSQNFDIYRAAIDQPYLNSLALSKIGTLANANPEAMKLLFSQLADPINGGHAAFALRQLDINTLADYVSKELNITKNELYQKRLLLSVKLHPKGNNHLQSIINTSPLAPKILREVSTWLN